MVCCVEGFSFIGLPLDPAKAWEHFLECTMTPPPGPPPDTAAAAAALEPSGPQVAAAAAAAAAAAWGVGATGLELWLFLWS